MNSKEIKEKYWQAGNIFVTRYRAYLIVNDDFSMGIEAEGGQESITGFPEYSENFKIGAVYRILNPHHIPFQDIMKELHNSVLEDRDPHLGYTDVVECLYRKELPFSDCKVFVGTKSREVQEKLFELGYRWSSSKLTEVMYESSPFLFTYSDRTMSHSKEYGIYLESPATEVTMKDILQYKD